MVHRSLHLHNGYQRHLRRMDHRRQQSNSEYICCKARLDCRLNSPKQHDDQLCISARQSYWSVLRREAYREREEECLRAWKRHVNCLMPAHADCLYVYSLHWKIFKWVLCYSSAYGIDQDDQRNSPCVPPGDLWTYCTIMHSTGISARYGIRIWAAES